MNVSYQVPPRSELFCPQSTLDLYMDLYFYCMSTIVSVVSIFQEYQEKQMR